MLLCKCKWPDLFIWNRLTLEQKELCRCRLKLLTYLDRLATYEVRAGCRQTTHVYLTCHRKCCGCPSISCPWSLELFDRKHFIMCRHRFSCARLLMKIRDWKATVVSLGSRNALSASLCLCFLRYSPFHLL